MSRLNVVVLEHDMRAALEELGRIGCAQLIPVRDGRSGEMLSEVDVADRLSGAGALLERVKALQRSLDCIFVQPPEKEAGHPSLDEIERLLPPVEKRVGRMLEERTRLTETLERLARQEEELSAIENLPVEAFSPDMLSFVIVRVGWLKTERAEVLEKESKDFAAIVTVDRREGEQLVVAIVPRKKRFVLQTLLEKLDFTPQKKPEGLRESPAQALRGVRRALQTSKDELERIGDELGRMGGDLGPQLARCREALEVETSLLRAMSQFGKTRFCCVASGWVPSADVPELCRRLEKITDGRAVIEARPVKHSGAGVQKVPVAMTSRSFFKPFRLLVRNFGLPSYGEIDPTPFLAISFLVLFGLMFGDVGQGAVLVGLGLVLRFAGKKETLRDFGFVLAAAGVSSMIFGVLLYGSVFGKEDAIMISPLLLRPLHVGATQAVHLTKLLVVAVASGVILMSAGIFLNIVNRFTAKEYFKGIVDKYGLVGIILYWGAIGLGILGYVSGVVPPWLVVLLVGLPLVLIVLAGPLRMLLVKKRSEGEHEEGLFMGLVEGFVELIETVIAFLANTASFIRVAAFALAHSGLSLAIWTIADNLSDVPVLPVVIVVFGNVLTIALEGLVAGIQAIRLEYYEFFGKFFGGDGVPFRPFKFKTSQEAVATEPPLSGNQ
ncbi:MAG: V-type ATPase 116kDa subunit family protein [Planctomycetota bacterium]